MIFLRQGSPQEETFMAEISGNHRILPVPSLSIASLTLLECFCGVHFLCLFLIVLSLAVFLRVPFLRSWMRILDQTSHSEDSRPNNPRHPNHSGLPDVARLAVSSSLRLHQGAESVLWALLSFATTVASLVSRTHVPAEKATGASHNA